MHVSYTQAYFFRNRAYYTGSVRKNGSEVAGIGFLGRGQQAQPARESDEKLTS